ncbi:MAG: copper resistance D family protein [Gemmatimonadales bacterium]
MPLDGYALARWLAYGATLVFVGLVAVPALIRRAGPDDPAVAEGIRRRAERLGLTAAVVLLAANLFRLWFQARSFLEPGEPLGSDMLRLVIGTGIWGTGWKLQFALSLLLVVTFLSARLRSSRVLVGALVLGMVIVTPLTGHGAAWESPGWRGVALHAVHLGATGAWLGTLLALAVTAFPALSALPAATRGPTLMALLGTFSPLALVGAATMVVSGGLLAWHYVGTLQGFVAYGYGRWLLVKLGLLAGTVGLGWRNWRVLTPRVEQGEVHGLARSAGWELAIGALIVLVTAILVALDPVGTG